MQRLEKERSKDLPELMILMRFPKNADLVIDTENEPLSESANKVKEFLKNRNLL